MSQQYNISLGSKYLNAKIEACYIIFILLYTGQTYLDKGMWKFHISCGEVFCKIYKLKEKVNLEIPVVQIAKMKEFSLFSLIVDEQ
jgi:hypothetical protein